MKTKTTDPAATIRAAFKAGIQAHAEGTHILACPHECSSELGNQWMLGYESAIQATLKNQGIPLSLSHTHAQEIDRLIDRTFKILELLNPPKTGCQFSVNLFDAGETTQAALSEALQWAQNITYRATLRVLDGINE